jgi:ion channel
MAPTKSERKENKGILVVVLALLISAPYTAGATRSLVKEDQWYFGLLVSMLFGIPVLAQIIGLTTLWSKVDTWFKRYIIGTTMLSVWGYSALWFIYYSSWRELQLFSCLAVILIIGVIGAVLMMTYALMTKIHDTPIPATKGRKKSPKKMWFNELVQQLHSGVLEHPFFAMLLFFTLFLSITFLLSFALAFHDHYALAKSNQMIKELASKVDKEKLDAMPALYMANIGSIDDGMNPPGKSEALGDSKSYTFYFGPNRAGLFPIPRGSGATCDGSAPSEKTDAELKKYERQGILNISQLPDELRMHNYCNLDAMAKDIESRLNKVGKKIRIVLVGHTDKEQIRSTDYISNYELSEARERNVMYTIREKLKEKKIENGIEWESLPLSSEPFPISVAVEPQELSSPKQKNRIVVATIEDLPDHISTQQIASIENSQRQQSKPKKLRLMDYVYFSVYTITTTGYGDIIPTTTYAKFLCSLANILEVFFLVVFVNALLNLKKEEKHSSAVSLEPLRVAPPEKGAAEERRNPMPGEQIVQLHKKKPSVID